MTDGSIHIADQGPGSHGTLARLLWRRELNSYPEFLPRVFYLCIVVAATIVLYYQLYVAGAVAPQILAHFGMSGSTSTSPLSATQLAHSRPSLRD